MIVSGMLRGIRNEAKPRETLELNKDDRQLLWLLGIDPEEVSLQGMGALREATAHACIKILQEHVAKLPAKVYRGREMGADRAEDHPLEYLVRLRPNPYMTATDMFRAVEAQRLIYGNAYIYPEIATSGPLRGQIVALWPIDARNVQIWVDEQGVLSTPYRVWYVVTVGGRQYRVSPESIVHLKALTVEGITGIAPLHYLRYVAENSAQAAEFLNKYFKQGLQARGIVHYLGDLDEAKIRTFRERFLQMTAGLKNAHQIGMLPVGFQYQSIDHKLVDAQFLENTQLTIRQIANAFGVKMHQLNDLERSTHTNIEHQQRQFYSDTLQFILTHYEQELTYKLFTPSELLLGYYIKFNVDSILRPDLGARYDAHSKAIRGFLTINEVRAMEDKPPLEGGDRLLVPKDLQPLDRALAGGDGSEQTAETVLAVPGGRG